ncbi:MAG: peptide chain release factor 3 [Gemmatimonadota bacterium]|nr:peptide chain release factor 3 [Gemmatimonadota bacterium]
MTAAASGTTTDPSLVRETARRRTFAIISHPDAGKTTLTEKLLLYGGAIHLAGAVKAKGASRHARSDWMALEQERGISVSSSVLQFDYRGRRLNLLDTPGHNDFSEDTYRTLTAADTAVMLIDCVKGVEPQTIKLFQVCRMRGIPVVTFINKLDRDGREPLELMGEIETVLGIPCTPVNWPIGLGRSFQGVFDRQGSTVHWFERAERGTRRAATQTASIDDPQWATAMGDSAYAQLREDLELLETAGHPFDVDEFLAGQSTPVFFGSALTNFGVEPFLDRFIDLAPSPLPRPTTDGDAVEPTTPAFTGFVFKIQANMDPRHRDRIAFVRVCSGKFTRGMEVKQVRTGKRIALNRPLQFLAQDRTLVEEAWPGDIVGLWDPGALRLGDALAEGEAVEFEGMPRFSPEHFMRIRVKELNRRKQLEKGLDQLSEEGAVQLFRDRHQMDPFPVLGAVGVLQFEVMQYRLREEYGVDVQLERLPYTHARWVEGDGFDPDEFERNFSTAKILLDAEDRPVVLFESEWWLRRAADKYPALTFVAAVQPARAARK